MNAYIVIFCQPCGHVQALPREGGNLEPCCAEPQRTFIASNDSAWKPMLIARRVVSA